MKIVVVLADGFEEIEAIAPIDVWRRLNFEVVLAGLDGLEATGSHQIKVKAEVLFNDCRAADFDAVFLPGGMPGAMNLYHSETVQNFIKEIDRKGGAVSAICAAPIVLAKAGLLSGRLFTMYPGFADYLDGMTPTGELAEADGNIVTGRGAGAAFAFAAKVAQVLGKGPECEQLYPKMFVSL